MQTLRILINLLVGVSIAVLSFSAQATLGEDFVAGAVTTQAKSAAAIQHIKQENYTVNQYTVESGVVVKEFVDLNNKVFAVVWKGPSKPDLSQLYGQYYSRYVTATANSSRPRSRHFSLKEPDLVINTKGRMGNFAGVSYLPDAMPIGITEADLQ